jgi:hypothetical protein
MGEYEPHDSRNVTGTATTTDGRWTGQNRTEPTRRDQRMAPQGEPARKLTGQDAERFDAEEASQARRSEAGDETWREGNQNPEATEYGQMEQSDQSIGKPGEGVSDASNQDNDHTSAIGAEYDATAQAGQTGWKTADIAGQVRQGQNVVDRDGRQVGTVHALEGDRIRLSRADSAEARHYVAACDVTAVEGNEVRLACTADSVEG